MSERKIQKNNLGEIHINNEIHYPFDCNSENCNNCSIYKYQNEITYSKCVDLCVFTDDKGNPKIVMFEEK